MIQWLDCKPRGSVLYVSFGSEVGLTTEANAQLALALEASNRPFIWVIQPGSGRFGPPGGGGERGYDLDLEEKVGERGLIISGWAPQLLILSHQSTGGFLSHCGWNSTVEAIGRGVPLLAWPLRGDQHFDAMLVVKHLKIGYMVFAKDASENVEKEAIVGGIEKLMGDKDMKRRAEMISDRFGNGFPDTSAAAFDAFRGFVNQWVPIKH